MLNKNLGLSQNYHPVQNQSLVENLLEIHYTWCNSNTVRLLNNTVQLCKPRGLQIPNVGQFNGYCYGSLLNNICPAVFPVFNTHCSRKQSVWGMYLLQETHVLGTYFLVLSIGTKFLVLNFWYLISFWYKVFGTYIFSLNQPVTKNQIAAKVCCHCLKSQREFNFKLKWRKWTLTDIW